MKGIIFSHEIREEWYVPRDCHYFSGRFFHGSDHIGEAMADLLDDDLAFHTCNLKCYANGHKIGQELVARSILFGSELAEATGLDIRTAYKYYSLTNTEEYRQTRGIKDYHNPHLDRLFERLGFRKCGPRNYCGIQQRGPMEARLGDVLAKLKDSWVYLFYQRRVEALGLDWNRLLRKIDMEEAERVWHANYVKARRKTTGPITDSPDGERVLEKIVAMPARIRIADGSRQTH